MSTIARHKQEAFKGRRGIEAASLTPLSSFRFPTVSCWAAIHGSSWSRLPLPSFRLRTLIIAAPPPGIMGVLWNYRCEGATRMATAHRAFKEALAQVLAEVEATGTGHADVHSGNLHGKVGGYPGRDHRMPVCCQVMREAMGVGDEILKAPPSGMGASLVIRYKLPRRH